MDDELGNLIEDNEEVGSVANHDMLAKNSISLFEAPDSESQAHIATAIDDQSTKRLEEKNFMTDSSGSGRKDLQKPLARKQGSFQPKSGRKIGANMAISEGDEGNINASAPPLLTPEEVLPVSSGFQAKEELVNENIGDRDENSEGLIKITILEDGHLRLMDSTNRSYFFSAEELHRRNIDANALTDDNIQEIIQIAMPQLLTDDKLNDEPIAKRRRPMEQPSSVQQRQHYGSNERTSLDQHYYQHSGALQSSHHQQHAQTFPGVHHPPHDGHHSQIRISMINDSSPDGNDRGVVSSEFGQPQGNIPFLPQSTLSVPRVFNTNSGNLYFRSHTNSAASTSSSRESNDSGNMLSDVGIGGLGHVMIGEEMEVRNAEGRIEMATVRYYRQGTGYKIQFADGHFEWLGEASVLELKHHQNNTSHYGKSNHSIGQSHALIQSNSSMAEAVTASASSTDNNSSTGSVRFHHPTYQPVHFRRIPLHSGQQQQQHPATQSYTNPHHSPGGVNGGVNAVTTSSFASTSASSSSSTMLLVDNGGIHHQPETPQKMEFQRPPPHHDGIVLSRNDQSQSAYRHEVMPPSVLGMRVTVNNDNNLNSRAASSSQSVVYQSNYPVHHQHPVINDMISLNNGARNYFENSYYCAVCDQHCTQDQITYIVVRIPACLGCSSSKVAILDDQYQQQQQPTHDSATVKSGKRLMGDNDEVDKCCVEKADISASSSSLMTPHQSQGCEIEEDETLATDESAILSDKPNVVDENATNENSRNAQSVMQTDELLDDNVGKKSLISSKGE